MNSGHERQLEYVLQLDAGPEKLVGLEAALGPGGIGTFVVPQVVTEPQLTFINQEINDPHALPWQDNHEDIQNARFTVVQRHDVYALKLSAGDQAPVERLPRLRALTNNIGQMIVELSDVFPALIDYVPDEMSLHRYDEPEVGLSFHKDNVDFFGLVAVLTTDGSKDLVIRTEDGQEIPHFTQPGDLMLTRVNQLYPHPKKYTDHEGKQKDVNICPDHGVYNVSKPYSTSFIVRANSLPQYQIKGFRYANWVGDKKPSGM
jgi:hypothetical protein